MRRWDGTTGRDQGTRRWGEEIGRGGGSRKHDEETGRGDIGERGVEGRMARFFNVNVCLLVPFEKRSLDFIFYIFCKRPSAPPSKT